MELFRDYLDVLCRTRGVQYAELARRIGVTKSYIGQLIHGHSKPPPPARCEQIADALELAPGERQQLLELAVRERARTETRVKLEELDGDVTTLRSATAELVGSLLGTLAAAEQPLPESVTDLIARDELLSGLYAVATSQEGDLRAALAQQLATTSPERLSNAMESLAAAFRAAPQGLEAAEPVGAPPPPVPVIGYVAAGETDVAFTDAGLPTGASLPGEDPVPRWPGVGEHAYALRISGESMMPLCPPGATIVVDPARTPRDGEPAICQTTEDKSYFKLVRYGSGGACRLVSTNPDAAPDISLSRPQVRRLQKVIAILYP